MAPYQAGSAYWKLYAYDVLHNCRRLDIGLFLQNGLRSDDRVKHRTSRNYFQ